MRDVRYRWMFLAATLSWACGSSSDELGEEPTNETPVEDMSGGIPEPGEGTLEFRLSPSSLEPGSESMLCEYFDVTTEDVWVEEFRSYQRDGGHHLILFQALAPKPAGTIEDCSAGDSMLDYMFLLAPREMDDNHVGTVDFSTSRYRLEEPHRRSSTACCHTTRRS